ncbi:DUF3575 domain-containing protein [Algoriphagus sp. CAU 1675]|uniref:DUF3575 domain-containing protein n=1 Tax=Algoriphagus sp. CAU 1675 TaxID=3032597 RepID=UPI0023DADFE4|nr:DUF3575 domain-containing protein [Algoriphagus sp. CAU 1675]MDF2159036.1 DUF3575 domain-containing protein [Algoriphagus sp. CAU 1675]
MKRLIFTTALILALSPFIKAQELISSSSGVRGEFSNEVKMNFLNMIVLGSIEVGYEKYLSEDHSLDFQAHINDRFGYNLEGKGKNYKTNSLQASMNFYFGDNPNGRFYIYPLAKVRFGDFEETKNGGIQTTNMNTFLLGVGLGYKWEFSSHFAFGPYASVSRGFNDEVAERFSRIEPNGGFSLGYRF